MPSMDGTSGFLFYTLSVYWIPDAEGCGKCWKALNLFVFLNSLNIHYGVNDIPLVTFTVVVTLSDDDDERVTNAILFIIF